MTSTTDSVPAQTEAHTIVLVGERFQTSAALPGVRTVSEFAATVAAGEYRGTTHPVEIVRGQDVSDDALDDLRATLARLGMTDHVRISDDVESRAADRDVVHKHNPENVLLADLRQLGPQTFTARLRVDGRNELLQDHQTGLHVQGMVGVEAARQMFLALFEVGYRHHWPSNKYFVVWNSMEIDFENFLFPLPASITATVLNADLHDPSKLDFHVRIEMQQSGRRVSCATINFTAFEWDRIGAVEQRRAAAAVTNLNGTGRSAT
ncbi:hypothetical protein SCATT_57470 [Streptantibioticus cattleyicolor NRRL 8057 = DSM 46488]|uniref:A-factor biosynthesis hotdog domain-containing protein n=1 Tax=Streptantibioticus cattleyicolor (strain ATCC 35852 / DSM 46488 / JCM 4925 / NBRC 14057 / NRRL 8057) TaxID=1003195 RepID=G8WYI7_STREN|nr:hypothetical protein SCATT_57470 [Streptantibioticus cattleyicolor NRRL 8057 = DSM 46488]